MAVQDQVHDLLEPIVATLDVELVDVTFTGGTLRVTVDRDDGITTESLAEVNRLISPILDQHDPVPGRYTLEVSSPGLERPLKRPAHFQRALDELVVVKLVPGSDPRRVRGRLAEIHPAGTDQADETHQAVIVIDVVEVDGVELDEPQRGEFPLTDVASARTSFDWGPGPKPGQPGAKKAKQHPKAAASRAKKATGPNAKKSMKKSAKKQSENPSLNREVRDEQ